MALQAKKASQTLLDHYFTADNITPPRPLRWLKPSSSAASLTDRAFECKWPLYSLSVKDVAAAPREGHNTQHPTELQKVRVLAPAESMCFQVRRWDSKEGSSKQ